jgi:hypothetical protein
MESNVIEGVLSDAGGCTEAEERELLQAFEQIEWDKYTRIGKNLASGDPRKCKAFGVCFVPSKGFTLLENNIKYPQAFLLMQRLVRKYHPKFHYTTITLNCELEYRRHSHPSNRGNTMIIGLGAYTGGRLGIEAADGSKEHLFDIHRKWLRFDGKNMVVPFGLVEFLLLVVRFLVRFQD